MSITTLAAGLQIAVNWQASKTVSGLDSGPQCNGGKTKKIALGTAAANNAAGGADELARFVQTIGASSSATIDLTSLTDILQASGVTLARVKAVVIELLSPDDDATLGTLASYVTVGNAASNAFASQSGTGFLVSTGTFDVPSGGVLAFGVPNAAGVAVDSTHKNLKIANADAGLSAKVRITFIGGTT